MRKKKIAKKIFINAVHRVLEDAGFDAKEREAALMSWSYAEDSEKFSHGFIRLPWLVRIVQKGVVIPQSQYAVQQNGCVIRIAGKKSLGYRAANDAVELCIEHAQKNGFAFATVRDCYPTGCMGEYVERMTQKNLIGFVVSSSAPRVSAYGATDRVFSTLGHAFGFPSNNIPYIYDSSVGSITHGQIERARQMEESLPHGTVMNTKGCYVTDPNDVFDQNNIFNGVISVAGGAEARKISGLAGSLELFARLALSEVQRAPLPSGYSCFFTINVAFITDAAQYNASVDDLIASIKKSRRMNKHEPVMFAGEHSYLNRIKNNGKRDVAVSEEVYQLIESYL